MYAGPFADISVAPFPRRLSWPLTSPCASGAIHAIRDSLAREAAGIVEDLPMKLSDGEKLILMMLADMYKHLKIQNPQFDPDFITNTITKDHPWGFKWAYSGIPFEKEQTPREVTETADILDMWWSLERAYQDLSPADKKKVNEATKPKDIKFIGFDGNNENHYGIARYFVEDLKSFEHFKDRDLNSHMPSIDNYRQMYRIFEPMRKTLANRSLNADEVVKIMNAPRRR